MVQNAISELINDPACYPDKSKAIGSERRLGFDDGYGYENCLWGRDIAPESIATEGSATLKLRTLFADKIGVVDKSLQELSVQTSEVPWFSTPDGMSWALGTGYLDYYPHSGTDAHAKGGNNCYTHILVDINGKDKGNNCFKLDGPGDDGEGNWLPHNKFERLIFPTCKDGKECDIYAFSLYANGAVYFHGGYDILNVSTGISGK